MLLHPRHQVRVGEIGNAKSRLFPDAVAWGTWDGHEVLFWCEVEGGQRGGAELYKKMIDRINNAVGYTRRFRDFSETGQRGMCLVYGVLGPQRIFRTLIDRWGRVQGDVAAVVTDWMVFGELPEPAWGKVVMA